LLENEIFQRFQGQAESISKTTSLTQSIYIESMGLNFLLGFLSGAPKKENKKLLKKLSQLMLGQKLVMWVAEIAKI